MNGSPSIARVVVDVPSRALTEPFDYLVPPELADAASVGTPVAVPFGPRRCVGYVVERTTHTEFAGELRAVEAVVGEPVFDERALELATWIANEYVAPLSEALRLFLPPGSAPAVRKGADGAWTLAGRQMGPASDVIVTLAERDEPFVPRSTASVQRAVLEALSEGPVTTAELAAEIPGARAAVGALEKAGAVVTEERRRYRRPGGVVASSTPHALTDEQSSAVERIRESLSSGGGVVLLDGITGSGKTEVYLAAITRVLAEGGTALVLVPEISLTPQTVGRFRARLGDDVAVIHSRLSAGERFDQWQLALEGRVHVVVGARSALFAPLRDVRLVIIDEEHEPSYKQGQAPRYHAREVAERLCASRGAVV
jgi:primosomal protein N' (replication factor Y)